MEYNVGDTLVIGNGAVDAGLEGTYIRTGTDRYSDRSKIYMLATKNPDDGRSLIGTQVAYLPEFVESVKPAIPFKVGDKVRVTWEFDAGIEGVVTKIDANTEVNNPINIKVTADPRHDKWVGASLWYGPDDIEVLPAERGIVPGDRVRVIKGAFEACEGTLTHSIDEFKRPVVLITDDPVGRAYQDSDEGRCVGFTMDSLTLIEPGTDQYHEAIDTLLAFV